MQNDSSGSGCIQDSGNGDGSGRIAHANGYKRGSAQDSNRSAKEVGDGGEIVKIDGFVIRCHHGGKVVNRGGGGGGGGCHCICSGGGGD